MAASPTTSATWTPANEVDRRIRAEILEAPEDRPRGELAEGLHVCPACLGPFAVPGEEFDVVGFGCCRIDLSCVDCGWQESVVCSDAELEALDRELDRGYAELLWALEIVWIGNEEDAIARFASALAVGALLPEDF